MKASTTPAMILMRALRDTGWITGKAPVLHTAISRKVYAIGGPKSYMQCLLELARPLEAGIEGVRSGQHALYYSALVTTRTPSLVLPDMKVAYYTAIVKGASPVDVALECAPSQSEVLADEDDGGDIVCTSASSWSARHGQDRAVNHATQEAAMPMLVMEEGDTEDIIATAGPTTYLQHVALTGIPGLTLLQDEHLTPGQAGHYRRVAVMCPLCDSLHKRDKPCKKYRNVGVAQTRLGPQEPVAFLAVWAANARRFTTARHHIAFAPSPAQVEEYMRSKGWLSE